MCMRFIVRVLPSHSSLTMTEEIQTKNQDNQTKLEKSLRRRSAIQGHHQSQPEEQTEVGYIMTSAQFWHIFYVFMGYATRSAWAVNGGECIRATPKE